MRKSMILAAIAALAMVSSCQKEDAPVQDSLSGELTFTATIVEPDTKTIIYTEASSANRGKVVWEVGDEISITDGTDTAIYYIKTSSDKAADGSANFTYKSGKRLSASATKYTATFGNAITDVQSYSGSYAFERNFPMSGESDPSDKTKLNFKVSCGLLKLALSASSTETDRTISKIEVTGTLTGGAKKTYTLTCNNSPLPAGTSLKYFHILLPAGDYTTMKFTNSTGNICFKTAKTPMVIKANTVQPVTLTGLTFSALLPGKFTVNAEGKQVQFSRANLYYSSTDSKYHLEAAQTVNYVTLGQTAYDATHVCHFFWSNTTDWQTSGKEPWAASYSYGVQGTADKFFCGQADPLTVDGQGGLYALTSHELYYLLITRGRGDSKLKQNVTVNGVGRCFIIAPDGYTGTIASSYDAAAWSEAESAGLVCLSPTGTRIGSTYLNGGTSGNYWLANPNTGDADYAYFMRIGLYGDGYDFDYGYNSRTNGCSVRLVTDAK